MLRLHGSFNESSTSSHLLLIVKICPRNLIFGAARDAPLSWI